MPLAMWLHQNQQSAGQMDKLGFVMLLSLIGLVPGTIVGTLIEALLGRPPGVAARIREIYNNYPLDLYHLEELSYD
jgi:hypothetical protein